MSYNHSPKWLVEKVVKRIDENKKEIEQAYARISEKYHDFLILLPQSEKIAYSEQFIDDNLLNLGVYISKGAVYLKISKPYLTVDGRLQMLRDEHEAQGKRFTVHPPSVIPFGQVLSISVTVDSDIYGSATGVSEIFIDGDGVNRTNPISNAQTSAIGRALSFLGYGLIGTGVGIDLRTSNEVQNTKPIIQQPIENSNVQGLSSNGGYDLYDFKVRLITPPRKLETGGVLFEDVVHENGKHTKLWFPPKHAQQALSYKPNEIRTIIGWYANKENCVNVAEKFNATVPTAPMFSKECS